MNAEGIRFAAMDDADAIRETYAPYILETAFTYEYDVPTREDFSARVAGILATHPYLVYEADGAVAAYAYASRYHERAAYQHSVSVSVYVANDRRGGGIGRKLYAALLDLLAAQGYYNAIAVISTPNPASERMHEKFGFERLGGYDNAGYKFGRWYGISWYRKRLRDFALPPAPIRGYREAGAELGIS